MSDESKSMTNEELRIRSCDMAMFYYKNLARSRMILPKRDDADLSVELEPKLPELLTVADAFYAYFVHGGIPTEHPEPYAETEGG